MLLFCCLYSFCDYRMHFCKGELKDLLRTIGRPLCIALKFITVFNIRPSVYFS